MNYRKLIQSNYIAADEFGKSEPTLTMLSVALVGLEDDKGKKQAKGVIAFKETPKAWILNRTNVECLAAMFGPETNDWIGKRVTLHALLVNFGAEKKNGIRVKGSPDLARAVTIEVKLPRRKAQKFTLSVTSKSAASAPPQDQAATPNPNDDQPLPGPDDYPEPGSDG